MSAIDKAVGTTMILSLIAVTHFMSYQYGRMYQCNLDKDYVYSIDFGKCVRIGKENVK